MDRYGRSTACRRTEPAGSARRAREAHADGLTPVVSISGYPTPTARPSFDSAAPDPTTDSGYWDYRCGLEGILGAVSRLPADDQPHVWEPFNEPDMVALYRADDNGQTVSASEPSATADGAPSATADSAPSATADSAPDGQTAVCTPSAAGSGDGAAKAACDYLLAARVIHQFAGHADDTVLAGVFSRLSPTYLAQYIAQLSARVAAGRVSGELGGPRLPRRDPRLSGRVTGRAAGI